MWQARRIEIGAVKSKRHLIHVSKRDKRGLDSHSTAILCHQNRRIKDVWKFSLCGTHTDLTFSNCCTRLRRSRYSFSSIIFYWLPDKIRIPFHFFPLGSLTHTATMPRFDNGKGLATCINTQWQTIRFARTSQFQQISTFTFTHLIESNVVDTPLPTALCLYQLLRLISIQSSMMFFRFRRHRLCDKHQSWLLISVLWLISTCLCSTMFSHLELNTHLPNNEGVLFERCN